MFEKHFGHYGPFETKAKTGLGCVNVHSRERMAGLVLIPNPLFHGTQLDE
ncbi:hypothetical protein SOASR030_15420 [Leminorella grimontii]|uniref:Uncharacterized protein n=1 Tax=Leminorella grimontii TaxID=82981 RepID=A0AAV5N1M7_9GAMM|nr:hypothetical protein SOASR030_15420 [Leminorella grimontii]